MHKILIIDDDADIRSLLRALLEFNGYEVVEAADGRAGIRQFEASVPDVVITDIVMPDQEGIATIMEIRKKNVGAKIIAMSGGGAIAPSYNYLPAAESLGADMAFMKPFNSVELLDAVRKLLL